MPKPSRNRSIIYDTGLQFEEDVDEPDKTKRVWYCMVDEPCRIRSTSTPPTGGITARNTSNATRHLSEVHGEFSWVSVESPQED